MDDLQFDVDGYVKLIQDATEIRRACLALDNNVDDFCAAYPSLTHEQARQALAGVVDPDYVDRIRNTLTKMSDLLTRKPSF